ncbi:hypothetical protein [Lutimonas zeaxanthinifaciens]|uniref:hypothetical protein n=1 Tax=Lutimonas zeaxanthinifaciens TaxID=3060215 RepID=UPI00265CE68E|nr:hypothetical protein [Lutimonas sp. YSD2104]WKK66689.1 hypothetical protein QZH61_03500 [Lutimonas sp. YSD2104]
MILNTTYSNKDNDATINQMVGKPFGIWDKLKMKGTGSGRMIITDVSPKLERALLNGPDINYANIELRPKGILVRITRRLDNFTWIIPYYQLYTYLTNGLSIHGQGEFLHFRNDRFLKSNKDFIKKMLNLKVIFTKDYYI